MEDKVRLHAVIHGHVHGVGFRYFVLQKATQLNINGWVRNKIDGCVEVLAEGSKESLINLLQSLHEGPQLSYITQVNHTWMVYKNEFVGFKITSTT